jgi:beta-1,4-mannosyltransferase
MNAHTLRSAIFSTVRLNPYVSLLAEGMRAAASDVQPARFERLTPGWCLRERQQYDIIHLHWAELQYAAGATRARARRFISFIGAVALAKWSGMRLVYTVHNLAQHEGRHGRLNRWANRLLYAWADAIHVHDDSVAEALRPALRDTGRLFVIPHGSYVGYYPDYVSREEARRQLGLHPDAYVYVTLGGLRPYKGIEELIAAFRSIEDKSVRLVIAGHPHEPAYAEDLRARMAGDGRIVAFLEHAPDDRVQVYLRAADICVLPYRQVTTSGAAILALSFQLPIIAPAIGPFPALIGEAAGIAYDATDEGALRDALEGARQLEWGRCRAAIDAYLAGITWANVGRQHVDMYRCITGVKHVGR